MPTVSAAAFERSITRSWAYGPRSLMRTTTDWPVRSLVTRTLVPNGSVLWAAVRSWVLKVSPFAVRLPWKPGPYQEAAPVWIGLLSSAAAGVAASAQPRARAVMVRALEALVILSGLPPLLQCTIKHIAPQQKPSSMTVDHRGYAKD